MWSSTWRAVEADDPARNRCGCFLPDLTKLATAPSADFRARIWWKAVEGASSCSKLPVLHSRFTLAGRPLQRQNLGLPMPLFVLLAMVAQAQASGSTAITVTGHPWAPFISPIGEPYRARTPTDDTLADWFQRADRNKDGFLTVDEFEADADRFFGKLDTDHDGEIGPDELPRTNMRSRPKSRLCRGRDRWRDTPLRLHWTRMRVTMMGRTLTSQPGTEGAEIATKSTSVSVLAAHSRVQRVIRFSTCRSRSRRPTWISIDRLRSRSSGRPRLLNSRSSTALVGTGSH